MSRIEEKILKIIGEYYGEEVDVDDDFFDNICTNEFEMFELIAILGHRNIIISTMCEAEQFTLVQDFIEWLVNNLEK
jgi:hypothetical protein